MRPITLYYSTNAQVAETCQEMQQCTYKGREGEDWWKGKRWCEQRWIGKYSDCLHCKSVKKDMHLICGLGLTSQTIIKCTICNFCHLGTFDQNNNKRQNLITSWSSMGSWHLVSSDWNKNCIIWQCPMSPQSVINQIAYSIYPLLIKKIYIEVLEALKNISYVI